MDKSRQERDKEKVAAPSPRPSKFVTTREQHERNKRAWEKKHGPLKRSLSPKRAMAADPEWWERKKAEHGGYLYHMTTDEAADSILYDGLYPYDHEENPRGSEWNGDALEPRPGHVYLAEQDKAEQIGNGQNKPVRLRINMNDLDPALVTADEDAALSAPGHVLPSSERPMNTGGYGIAAQKDHAKILEIENRIRRANPNISLTMLRDMVREQMAKEGVPRYRSYGEWANSTGYDLPEHTAHSLDEHRTIAYNGAIPAEAIERDGETGPECPQCGEHSGYLYEGYGGKVEGECPNCEWDSATACPDCQSYFDDDDPSCSSCGYSIWTPGEAVWFGHLPGVIHSVNPFRVSLNGEPPVEVDHQEVQPAVITQPWQEPTHPDFPLTKYPEQYRRYNPDQLQLMSPWGETWKTKAVARKANILDPLHDALDASVFDDQASPEPRLKEAHRQFIFDKVYSTLKKHGYENPEAWLSLVLTGSLTTYQYGEGSDVDISLFVNHALMPDWSRAELIGIMVGEVDGTTLPGTHYPLQIYVVPPDIDKHDLYQPGLRSGYDLIAEEWIVPPEKSRSHEVDANLRILGLLAADKMERLLRYEPTKAKLYWHQIHSRRQKDQRAGKGDYSESNVIYKTLANRGLFPQISEATGEYIAKTAMELRRPQDWERMRQLVGDPEATDEDLAYMAQQYESGWPYGSPPKLYADDTPLYHLSAPENRESILKHGLVMPDSGEYGLPDIPMWSGSDYPGIFAWRGAPEVPFYDQYDRWLITAPYRHSDDQAHPTVGGASPVLVHAGHIPPEHVRLDRPAVRTSAWTKEAGVAHDRGQWGRGVVTPQGEVHTWPEDLGTHNAFIFNVLGDMTDFGYDKFLVSPDGQVQELSDPAHRALVDKALAPRVLASGQPIDDWNL